MFQHLLTVCELWQHCQGLVPVACQHTVLEITGMLRLHLNALRDLWVRHGGRGWVGYSDLIRCWAALDQHGKVLETHPESVWMLNKWLRSYIATSAQCACNSRFEGVPLCQQHQYTD